MENEQQGEVIEEQRHTTTPQVHILDEHFKVPELQAERRVWLYLPAEYDYTDKYYPVIYMQDGQNVFDRFTASHQEWAVDETMDTMFANHSCIIVAVDHGGERRISEYNPYDSEEHGPGLGNAYAEFLVNTLKPYIDNNYRTHAEPKFTAIAGSSMGGLMAMYAALKYPQIFGNAGVFSPAFWIAKDIYAFALNQEKLSNLRCYFVCGDSESDDMVGDMEGMAAIIKGKVCNPEQVSVNIIPGATHCEEQWRDDFPAFYEWLGF